MRLIDEPTFPLDAAIRLVALQGDFGIQESVGPGGGRWIVDQPDRARLLTLELIEHARRNGAHIALIPELVIPQQALGDLIAAVDSDPSPLIVVGGVEGLTPTDYRALASQQGGTPDIAPDAPGTYVNAMIVIVRTPAGSRTYWRAKRYASGAENASGPQMVTGQGPFLVLRLGTAPFILLPVICSEFVWPELWGKVDEDAPGGQVDVMPVLQRNYDPERRHLTPVIHAAYQRRQTRFVFANQSLVQPASDGMSYVIVPPSSPAAPAFDHGRNELWLPESTTYKGFRIPDRTGCVWMANIAHRDAPTSATRPPICGGRVLTVLHPSTPDLTGLSSGLMRSAALSSYVGTKDWAATEPRQAFRVLLDAGHESFVLRGSSRDSASAGLFGMICDVRPTWSTVESLAKELVEGAALLGAGGDRVCIEPCAGGNCAVGGRSVALLYAPNVDGALATRFSSSVLLSGAPLPFGVVLVDVASSARHPRAKTIGDVLRADRISSDDPELSDSPLRTQASSVRINLGEIHFCEVRDLRPGLVEATSQAARARMAALLPGVFS